MGWRICGNQKYYYRARRVGGRAVSEYVGKAGGFADLAYALDLRDRAEREADWAEERDRRQSARDADSRLDGLIRSARRDAHAAIERAGWQRHHRGWRRFKGRPNTEVDSATMTSTTPCSTVPALLPIAATSTTRTMPRDRFRRGLERWAASEITAKLTPLDGSTYKRILQDAVDHAVELAGPNPTPIEATLAETAAICWLMLRHAETVEFLSTQSSPAWAGHAVRRVQAIHNRYLATLRTLAQVRKLALPDIKQVNIAGDVTTMTAVRV